MVLLGVGGIFPLCDSAMAEEEVDEENLFGDFLGAGARPREQSGDESTGESSSGSCRRSDGRSSTRIGGSRKGDGRSAKRRAKREKMEREQRKLQEKRQLKLFRSVGLVWQCVQSAFRCLLLIIKKLEVREAKEGEEEEAEEKRRRLQRLHFLWCVHVGPRPEILVAQG